VDKYRGLHVRCHGKPPKMKSKISNFSISPPIMNLQHLSSETILSPSTTWTATSESIALAETVMFRCKRWFAMTTGFGYSPEFYLFFSKEFHESRTE
jgi:hypothetical protein